MLKVASNKHSDFPYILLVSTLQKRFPLLLNVWTFLFVIFFNLLFNKDALTLGYSPRTYTYLGKLAARWCSTELKLQYSSIKGIKAPLIPVLLGKETSKELRIIPE